MGIDAQSLGAEGQVGSVDSWEGMAGPAVVGVAVVAFVVAPVDGADFLAGRKACQPRASMVLIVSSNPASSFFAHFTDS